MPLRHCYNALSLTQSVLLRCTLLAACTCLLDWVKHWSFCWEWMCLTTSAPQHIQVLPMLFSHQQSSSACCLFQRWGLVRVDAGESRAGESSCMMPLYGNRFVRWSVQWCHHRVMTVKVLILDDQAHNQSLLNLRHSFNCQRVHQTHRSPIHNVYG